MICADINIIIILTSIFVSSNYYDIMRYRSKVPIENHLNILLSDG